MVNGPEPTEFLSLAKLAGSLMPFQMCSGTIGSSAPGFEACASASVICTVCLSGAVTDFTLSSSPPLACCSSGSFLIASKVQATSSAVCGLPSDQTRPLGMVKVQVLPSFEVDHLLAMP